MGPPSKYLLGYIQLASNPRFVHALSFRKEKNAHYTVHKLIFTPSPVLSPAPPVSNTLPTSCPPPQPPALPSSHTQSRPPPHVAGLLTDLGSGNDASPYVCAAAAVLNRENKCGILNIRIIVSLPLTAVLGVDGGGKDSRRIYQSTANTIQGLI